MHEYHSLHGREPWAQGLKAIHLVDGVPLFKNIQLNGLLHISIASCYPHRSEFDSLEMDLPRHHKRGLAAE